MGKSRARAWGMRSMLLSLIIWLDFSLCRGSLLCRGILSFPSRTLCENHEVRHEDSFISQTLFISHTQSYWKNYKKSLEELLVLKRVDQRGKVMRRKRKKNQQLLFSDTILKNIRRCEIFDSTFYTWWDMFRFEAANFLREERTSRKSNIKISSHLRTFLLSPTSYPRKRKRFLRIRSSWSKWDIWGHTDA